MGLSIGTSIAIGSVVGAFTVVLRAVATGTSEVGQTLTAALVGGSLTDATLQWYRDGVSISGATAQTYTLVDADDETEVTVEIIKDATTYLSDGVVVLYAPAVAVGLSPVSLPQGSTTQIPGSNGFTSKAGGAYSISGGGGAGATINSTSGAINVSAVAAGAYSFTVTYTNSGGAVAYSVDVTITAAASIVVDAISSIDTLILIAGSLVSEAYVGDIADVASYQTSDGGATISSVEVVNYLVDGSTVSDTATVDADEDVAIQVLITDSNGNTGTYTSNTSIVVGYEHTQNATTGILELTADGPWEAGRITDTVSDADAGWSVVLDIGPDTFDAGPYIAGGGNLGTGGQTEVQAGNALPVRIGLILLDTATDSSITVTVIPTIDGVDQASFEWSGSGSIDTTGFSDGELVGMAIEATGANGTTRWDWGGSIAVTVPEVVVNLLTSTDDLTVDWIPDPGKVTILDYQTVRSDVDGSRGVYQQPTLTNGQTYNVRFVAEYFDANAPVIRFEGYGANTAVAFNITGTGATNFIQSQVSNAVIDLIGTNTFDISFDFIAGAATGQLNFKPSLTAGGTEATNGSVRLRNLQMTEGAGKKTYTPN